MELKKILLLISLSLFFFGNCQAGRHNESDEENCCFRSLRKLSSVFSCLFGDCLGTSSPHHYKRIDYNEDNEIEEFISLESQPISTLPNEILYQVAVFLSPPDIISLFKSSKQFSCLMGNNFWSYYNKKYDYFSWNEEFPAITVAFSYYWFRNNKIRKAAVTGFPRAREFIKQQERLKRESPSKPYVREGLNEQYMRFMFIHRKYL